MTHSRRYYTLRTIVRGAFYTVAGFSIVIVTSIQLTP